MSLSFIIFVNRANICSHFPGWYFSHFKFNQKGPWCLFSRGLPQLPKHLHCQSQHLYNTQYFSILVTNILNFETPFTNFFKLLRRRRDTFSRLSAVNSWTAHSNNKRNSKLTRERWSFFFSFSLSQSFFFLLRCPSIS